MNMLRDLYNQMRGTEIKTFFVYWREHFTAQRREVNTLILTLTFTLILILYHLYHLGSTKRNPEP